MGEHSTRELTTRLAQPSELTTIIALSSRVQDKLTASGSLQQIGPLEHHVVEAAIAEGRLFVAIPPSNSSDPAEVIGVAFIRPVSRSHFPVVKLSADFNELSDYSEPWWYLHSFMMDPAYQSNGLGKQLLEGVLTFIRTVGFGKGTLLLDCWAGSEGLRKFYERCGGRLVVVVPKQTWEAALYAISLSSA